MPFQKGLADALRDFGLDVAEYAGWQTRGQSSFSPKGVVVHHTGGWSSVAAMVKLCINGRGRPGDANYLPGPLCHVLLDPDGACHVIAAGRANHAGAGGWHGLAGNTTVYGIEAIHDGTTSTPWPAAQLAAFPKAAAALARLAGAQADMVCAHREWAPTRKIDPVRLDMASFRTQVALTLAPPAPPTDPGGAPVANRPFADILVHPSGGYLEIGEDGGVFAWGGAPFFGSLGGTVLNQPIVAAEWAPDYEGYYLLGRDGGIFTFGSARHQGNALWGG